jgi:probable DNA metabolism protein
VKAKRVWKGMKKRLPEKILTRYYWAFLTEVPEVYNLLTRFARYVFDVGGHVVEDYSNPDILRVEELNNMLHREKHRFEAFVRFDKGADGRFYAAIDPDFNVLPVIEPHFRDRYADQEWIIYDVTRHYGLYYDLHKTEAIQLEDAPKLKQHGLVHEADSADYQQLWFTYFKSVSIKARENKKLHYQHVPLRYWKYLPEKFLKD